MDEESRQYFLKWNNHPTNVASVFEKLRLEELFCDVSLATSDRQVIRAHRVILSAGSAYLERLLAVTASDHPTIVLSNIRYKELKLLIDFMYCGEVAVEQTQFPGLMDCANWLLVRGLCQEEKEDGEESSEKMEIKEELTVTPTGKRKRHTSSDSEEEEAIPPPEGETVAKRLFSPIQGVANAVWMWPRDKSAGGKDDQVELGDCLQDTEDSSNIPNLLSDNSSSPRPTKPLDPATLNEQLMLAMQLQLSSQLYLPLSSNSSSNCSTSPFKTSVSPGGVGGSGGSLSASMAGAPVRRYKQYTEDSLQAALRDIMGGQSINRSSMKHNIPARTLRDWMKRLNIKSVYTHHSSDRGGVKERAGSQGSVEDDSLASSSPEPERDEEERRLEIVEPPPPPPPPPHLLPQTVTNQA